LSGAGNTYINFDPRRFYYVEEDIDSHMDGESREYRRGRRLSARANLGQRRIEALRRVIPRLHGEAFISIGTLDTMDVFTEPLVYLKGGKFGWISAWAPVSLCSPARPL
jgi:hypothetical protein